MGADSPSSQALRGFRPSGEPNNRLGRGPAAGRGFCGPAPPSPSGSPLSPVPGSRPSPPSPRHHSVRTPRPQRLRPSSASWAPQPRLRPPESISGADCGGLGWGVSPVVGSARVAPPPLRWRRAQWTRLWPVRRCPGVGTIPTGAGVDEAPQAGCVDGQHSPGAALSLDPFFLQAPGLQPRLITN